MWGVGSIEDATTRGLGITDTEPQRRRGPSRRELERPEPAPGDVIGRYTLVERLGAGGMGVVFSAYDAQLDRRLALKLLHGALALPGEPTDGRARLLREAQAMAQLSHPNVVEVFDVGTDAGSLYIAMALVDGGTLRQWLALRPRSVPQTVSMLVQAGQGLAAAHAAGLVHRDFKPGNVLVDCEGQARVVDFGLALPAWRGHADAEPRSGSASDLASSSMSTDRLGSPVTEIGMVMGTPAYMAPEQHGGEAVGPAADQFAFCVALYEAVYGVRPFTGDDVEVLWRAKRSGAVPPPPAGHPAPAGLHRVIAAGLRPRAEDRFASMDALLAALAPFVRPRSPRRIWGLVGLGALALAGSLAGAWARLRPDDDAACVEARAALGSVWGEPRREALRTALQAGTAAYAADTVQRVEARLDDYRARWLDLHARICDSAPEDAHAAAIRERKLECLERRRRRMATLVEVLGDARTDVLAQAAGLVQGLPSLEGCASDSPADGELVLPDDAATALRVSEIAGALEEVQALVEAAQYERAHARLVDLHAQAEALGYAPLAVRTEAWLGEVLLRMGDRPAAEARLVHALHQAEAADDDGQVVLVVTRLVMLTNDRPEEGLRWARHGQARLPRIPEHASAHATMRGTLGMALLHAGQAEEGAVELARAVELWTALVGPDELQLAVSRNNLGIAYYDLGRFADAIAEYEQALRIRERALGPSHPEVGEVVNNLANASMQLGQPARALVLQQRALAIWSGALGPDHPYVGASYSNLGNAARAVGRQAEAMAAYERSIALRERALGSDHPEVAVSLINYGTLLGELGRYADAGEVLRRARSILERSVGDHPWTMTAIASLGAVLSGQGDHAGAVRAEEQAWAMARAIGFAEHPDAVGVRRRLGEALLAAGRVDEARSELEAALVLHDRGGVTPDESAGLALALARALRAQGEELPRARALAERARSTWSTLPGSERQHARAEALLRQLDGRSP